MERRQKEPGMKRLILSMLGTLTLIHASVVIVAKPYCPYYCSNLSPQKGFAVDIATHIFEQQGYSVEYKTVRTKEAALKGLANKEYTVYLSDEQAMGPGLIFAKTPISYKYDVFLVPKLSKWKPKTLKDLQSIRIGIRKSRNYPPSVREYLDKNRENEERIEVSKGKYALKDNLVKLQYNKIGTMIDNQHQMQYYYHKRKKPFPFKVAKKLEGSAVYAIFSTRDYKAKKYARQFNRMLKKLQESQAMSKLLKPYGLIKKDLEQPRL